MFQNRHKSLLFDYLHTLFGQKKALNGLLNQYEALYQKITLPGPKQQDPHEYREAGTGYQARINSCLNCATPLAPAPCQP
jgi:hypothetical protein